MTPVALGLGCRSGVTAEAVMVAVSQALTVAPADAPVILATIASKQGEPGLTQAAALMALPLVFVPRDRLEAASDRAVTRSERVVALHGVPSVAETAALAVAGPTAQLIMPRRVIRGVTCALARAPEASSE